MLAQIARSRPTRPFITAATGHKLSAKTTQVCERRMPTFAEIERDGWNDRASVYEKTTAQATTQAIPTLLSAVQPRFGHRLLDICSGPGFAAGAAAAIGCDVTGVDFAEEMVKVASVNFPNCRFLTGDAQALNLENATFDAAICNFGVFHFTEPELAMAEAARVLKIGGRYAWSQWHGPETSAFFGTIFNAVTAHANMDVGLPPSPPPFRMSDAEIASTAMEAAGFEEIKVKDVPIVLGAPADTFMDFFKKLSVRMTMILDRQDTDVKQAIEDEIMSGLAQFDEGGILQIPMPAIVVSGRKSD
jgi:SAM-dependent methyltransferase